MNGYPARVIPWPKIIGPSPDARAVTRAAGRLSRLSQSLEASDEELRLMRHWEAKAHEWERRALAAEKALALAMRRRDSPCWAIALTAIVTAVAMVLLRRYV